MAFVFYKALSRVDIFPLDFALFLGLEIFTSVECAQPFQFPWLPFYISYKPKIAY